MLPSLFNNPPQLNPDLKVRHSIAARMIRARIARIADESRVVIETFEKMAA